MKKLPLCLLFTIFGIVLVISCKKSVSGLFNGEPEVVKDIQWAKDYYNTTLQNREDYKLKIVASSEKSVRVKNPDMANTKKPQWENSSSGKTLIYNYVEIPIKYTHKVSYTFTPGQNPNVKPTPNQRVINASFDRLVIYKTKEEKLTSGLLLLYLMRLIWISMAIRLPITGSIS